MISKASIFWMAMVTAVSIGSAHAQTSAKVSLKGVVLGKSGNDTLRMASVRNVFSGYTVISRRDGSFIMPVSKGNILAVSATGFYTDTLTVTDSVLALSSLQFRLKALPPTLPGVVVSAHLNRYQADSIERRKNFLALVGESKIPAVGRANELGFGIALNIDRFSNREKKKRGARELFDITEQEAYINYRWNEEVVYKYTKLAGDSLTSFIQEYRPTWDWLRSNPKEEDLLYYINKCLKKYHKRPE